MASAPIDGLVSHWMKRVGELRVLAVGVDHVAGARRLRIATHLLALPRRVGNQAGELLAFHHALLVRVAVAHHRGERHHREGLAAAPEGVDLRRAPALDVRRHVFDDGRELLDRRDPLRRVDLRLHVLVEQEPAEVGREVAIGEVDRAIPHRAVHRLVELDPPARLARLGLEVRGHLLPLVHGLGAARLLAELRLVFLAPAGSRRCPCARENQLVAVEHDVVELAVVVLLELQPRRDIGEIRLALRRVLVERQDHLSASRIGHRVGEIVEDVEDAGLRHRLVHHLRRDVGVAERHDLKLHPGQVLPLLGEVGERAVVERVEQDRQLGIGEVLFLDVGLGPIHGPLCDRVLLGLGGRYGHYGGKRQPDEQRECPSH